MKPEPSRVQSVFSSAEETPAKREPSEAAPTDLERVIEATLASLAIHEGSANYASLLEVARQHRGRSLELDPIGVELVQAALGPQFRSALGDETIWREMTGSIAASFFADAGAHARLVALWSKLQEAARA